MHIIKPSGIRFTCNKNLFVSVISMGMGAASLDQGQPKLSFKD